MDSRPSKEVKRIGGTEKASLAAARLATARVTACAECVGVIHRAEGNFGAGGVGNYVGGATAGDYADVESGAAEELVFGQRNFANFLQGVEKFVNRGFA